MIPVILFALASGITPGPNNTLLLHSGARHGYRRSLPHIFGIILGMVPLFVVIGSFLTKIQDHFPTLKSVLFALSGAYILYLSLKIALAKSPRNQDTHYGKAWSLWKAAGFQWLNPKVWMMALGVFGSGIGGGSGWARIAAVTLIFALVCFPTMSIWTLFGTAFREILRNPIGFRILHISLGTMLSVTWIL